MKIEVLHLQNITRRVGSYHVLDSVTFSAFKGEVLGVLGLNDSGVYALAGMLSGKHIKNSGETYIDEMPVSLENRAKARKAGLYYIEHIPKLVPTFTVAESLFVTQPPVMHSCWLNVEAINARAQKILDDYQIPIDIHQRTTDLTQCEQNIIEIMRAVIQKARIVVLNRILATYDLGEAAAINGLIKKLAADGLTFIIIGTDPRNIADVADRLVILRNGKVEAVFYAGDFDDHKIYTAMTMVAAAAPTSIGLQSVARVGLELKNMAFPELNIEHADFWIMEGEVVGFVDEFGRGLTRIIDILNGDERFVGEVFLNGEKLMLRNRRSAVRHGIGYFTRYDLRSMVFDNLSIGENIILGKYPEYSVLGFINERLCHFALSEYIELYDLFPQLLDDRPDEIDDHLKAIIPLLKSISLKPRVMLLDDPFAGVDRIIEQYIYRFINYLRERNTCIVFCSPLKSELQNICDRIYVLKNGSATVISPRALS